MWSTSSKTFWAIFLLFGLYLSHDGICASAKAEDTLSCYQCLSISCPNSGSPVICPSVRDFVESHLGTYYKVTQQSVVPCPDAGNEQEWHTLKAKTGSCPNQAQGTFTFLDKSEDTCTLGRFRVTTYDLKTRMTFVSFGTVLGCAQVSLLKNISDSATNPQNTEIDSLFIEPGCRMDRVKSLAGSPSIIYHSLVHEFELEHCLRGSDLCHGVNFCINPGESEVRGWLGDKERKNGGRPPKRISFFVLMIIGVIGIMILVGLLTLLGIKYG